MKSTKTNFKNKNILQFILIFFCLTWAFSAFAQKMPASSFSDDNFDWEPVGLGGGGAMFAPAVSRANPDLMFINSDMSDAFMSRDGGKSWNMIHHRQLRGNTRCRPAFHPENQNIIYAADGWHGKLKKSEDGGKTFNLVPGMDETLQGEILIDPGFPDRIILGTAKSEVFISGDGGETWNKCPDIKGVPISFHFDQTSPTDKRVCFAATSAGIWRSDDGGKTWNEKTKGIHSKKILSFAGASNSKTGKIILYCSVIGENDNGKYAGGIYRSLNKGENWESAMGENINKDLTQADSWADGPIAQYMCLLAADSAPETIYAFNTRTGFNPPKHNAVFRSDDGGKKWRATFYSDPRWSQYNVKPNWRTANIGQNYQSAGFGWAICPSDPERVIFCDDGFCYITHDGGKSWFNGNSDPAVTYKTGKDSKWYNRGLVVTSTWHYYVDPFDPNRHYICYTDIGFAISEDRGKTWNWWGKDRWAPWTNTCYELAFDPTVKGIIWGAFSNVHDIPNGNIIYGRHNAKGKGGVCQSKDFGLYWHPCGTGLPESAVTSIVIDPNSPENSRTLYAGVWENGVYKSADGGGTWIPMNNGLGSTDNMRVSKIFLHKDGSLFALVTALRKDNIFIGGGTGLYRSGNGAVSWEKITATEKFLWPKDFTVDPENSKIIYLGNSDANGKSDGGLYKSEDRGKTWKLLARKSNEHFGAYLDPHRKGWIYMTLSEEAQESGLYLSKDNGKTFNPVLGIPFSNVQRIEFDPNDDKVIYATTFGGSVWKGTSKK